jgi:hypothetical protein
VGKRFSEQCIAEQQQKMFGDNYTLEFDLIYFYNPSKTGYLMPELQFGMFSTRGEDNLDNSS